MNVWLVHLESYGEVQVWSEDTDITETPSVKTELGYLEGGYEDERAGFIDDVKRAVAHGSGEASIEERLWVELVEVRSTS